MHIKPYIIPWTDLLKYDFMPEVEINKYDEILSFRTDGHDIIMFVLHKDEEETKKTKIAFVQSGFNIDDVINRGLIYHSTIQIADKDYHIFCNEYM